MFSVAVVDDHADLRAMIGMLLESNSEFQVCGTGGSGLDAIRLAEDVHPDVMLLDLSMPGMDGYEALPPILQRSPGTRVVVLTGHDLASCERQVAELGALGVLEKSVRMTDLPDRLLDMLGTSTAASFEVLPEQSAVIIEARSTVGPIAFGAAGVSGRITGSIAADGSLDLSAPATASLVVPIAALTSGNALYDAEIRDRLDSRRFPSITALLLAVTAAGDGRVTATGELTIHGTTRRQSGAIDITLTDDNDDHVPTLIAAGTQVVDVRDFDIELPSVLMLQIYPDVVVRYRVVARIAPDVGSDSTSSRTEN